MPGPVQPFLGVGERFEDANRLHALLHDLLKTLETGRLRFATEPFQRSLAAFDA